LGKGFCSGLFVNSFLPIKINIKIQKSVADLLRAEAQEWKGSNAKTKDVLIKIIGLALRGKLSQNAYKK